jgi:hypothetical protein
MPSSVVSAVLTVLFLAGCAATTPAPRFSAVSPADAEAPEAATPPPAPALAAEPEGNGLQATATDAKPSLGHQGHSMPPEPAATHGHEGHASAAPATPGSAAPEYSCPKHPEVKQASPGSCPKCGMSLVKRKDGRQRP